MKINWLPLLGKPAQVKEEIMFSPTIGEDETPLDYDEQKAQKLRSNIKFKGGEIEFKVFLENSKDKIQLILGADEENKINIGLNSNNAAYGIAQMNNGQYGHISNNGIGVDLPTSQWIQVKIKCNGSNIELIIDDVQVCSANANFHNSQVELLYRGVAEAKVKDFKIIKQLPKAFIVMQFTDEFNSLYVEIIKPICEKFGYEVVRADNMFTNGVLIEDITSAIRDCSLVLADITPDNPNVYYEVGYAHAINKPTIMLCDKVRSKLPFDVSGFRCIFYSNSISGKSQVESSLIKHLEALQ
ncbi:hypothetical protein [Psychromonas hadalis]|uniref:hypothetical protein n=1 Tax=Psychromonas hadalis TaxID=211669 RepID=UPI0003B3BCA7|nr:hypothetical protein [Psychromonas hadalis]